MLGGCASQPAPAAARVDTERAALEQAVAWPDPTVETVLTLGTTYFSSRREKDAHAYFSRRARLQPDRGLFVAMAALFRVRMADQVPLTRRVKWVREGLRQFDEAVSRDPGIPRFLRAATLARLPKFLGETQRAIAELRWCLGEGDAVLAAQDITPTIRLGMRRAALHSLAIAHGQAGDEAAARKALARSGATALDPFAAIVATPYSVSATDGFRFAPPSIERVAERVHVAHGFDFGNIVFVETGDGVVVIDAGTTVENAKAALDRYRAEVSRAPVVTLILTHGHWDHIGGTQAIAGPGVEIIANAKFAAEQNRVNSSGVGYAWFFGEQQRRVGQAYRFDVTPTRLIAEEQTLTVGDTTVELIPVSGGETDDALIVHLPAEKIAVVGDAFMPYFGAPFVGEGDPSGVLEVIDRVVALAPDELVHGHPPLSHFFTIEAMPALGSALRELRRQANAAIASAVPEAELLRTAPMPATLRGSPQARLPFVVMRTQFVQRIYRQRTGYWQSDGAGLEPTRAQDLARALDLVAKRGPRPWRAAIAELLRQGDPSLAWQLSEYAVRTHPSDKRILALREQALERLREKYQLFNPFKFIIYSEMSRVPLRELPGPARKRVGAR